MPNAVNITVPYVKYSYTSCILLVLIPLGNAAVSAKSSVFLVLDIETSKGKFLLTNISQGTYQALTYIIKGDGLLPLGVNSPTFDQFINITGDGMFNYFLNNSLFQPLETSTVCIKDTWILATCVLNINF